MATQSGMKRFSGIFKRLRGDRSGVGAVEFAFIAPVMIVLYIGAVEVTVAMSVNKKLARASKTVADLVTQKDATTKTELVDMEAVAKSVMTPYDPEPLEMAITGISINAAGAATVAWSWKPNDGMGEAAYTKGSAVDVPENLLVPGSFLVRSELFYRHDMITSFPITGETMTGIDMEKTDYFGTRIGNKVTCATCT